MTQHERTSAAAGIEAARRIDRADRDGELAEELDAIQKLANELTEDLPVAASTDQDASEPER
jgi:hypothetical protein